MSKSQRITQYQKQKNDELQELIIAQDKELRRLTEIIRSHEEKLVKCANIILWYQRNFVPKVKEKHAEITPEN